jgi:hypothetical protein
MKKLKTIIILSFGVFLINSNSISYAQGPDSPPFSNNDGPEAPPPGIDGVDGPAPPPAAPINKALPILAIVGVGFAYLVYNKKQ